ncbi:SusD/RagB family nutrient-binding outer membrane lipoprotein [Aquimarina sp. W85]|uniref:SusD/RagB family nutrient-binding outer membrane lipoprotein n=1 Tax=Aquimarina rhodophyticola TaxID=3342246 RepID=UPI00366DB0A0
MKIYKLKFIVLLAATVLASCSDYSDGFNDDPNNFQEAPGNLLIGQANLSVLVLSESGVARTAGIFSDQFTGDDRQYIPLNNYITTAGDYDGMWNDIYADGLKEAVLAEQSGAEDGDQILEGVAQIIQGLLLGEAAALWGDVPFSEALNFIDFPNPSYDEQATVLQNVQEILSNGIANVGSAGVGIYGVPVYEDNNALWAEIGHSLKARYYMIAGDYPNALLEARLGISSRENDLVSSHGTADGSQNMFYQFTVLYRPGYMNVSNSHLRKLVQGEVPRALPTPGDVQRDAFYFFDNTTSEKIELNTNEDGFFAIDAGFPIVSWYETKLIEAEAAFRTSGDALTPFNEVRAELSVQYGAAFPPSASVGDQLLEEILEEKYITLIGSAQVYHDLRRTDNLIGVPVKGANATTIPQRFLYPQTEIGANENFPGLIDLFEETDVNK